MRERGTVPRHALVAEIGRKTGQIAFGEEFRRRSERDDAPALDECRMRRGALCIAGIVGHEDHREPSLVAKIADELQHVVAQRRSERGERLVEQENGPLAHQRARDRDTLALAARQLARKPPLEAGEPDSAKRSG